MPKPTPVHVDLSVGSSNYAPTAVITNVVHNADNTTTFDVTAVDPENDSMFVSAPTPEHGTSVITARVNTTLFTVTVDDDDVADTLVLSATAPHGTSRITPTSVTSRGPSPSSSRQPPGMPRG